MSKNPKHAGLKRSAYQGAVEPSVVVEAVVTANLDSISLQETGDATTPEQLDVALGDQDARVRAVLELSDAEVQSRLQSAGLDADCVTKKVLQKVGIDEVASMICDDGDIAIPASSQALRT